MTLQLAFGRFAVSLLCWLAVTQTSFGQPQFKGDWHIERTPVQHLEATLHYTIEAPNLTAREWAVFATVPPELDFQSDVKATLRGAEIVTEASPLKRRLLFLRVPVDGVKGRPATAQSLVVQVDYQATLVARKLVPGKPSETVKDLSKEEREHCLRSSPTCDLKSKEVQDWLGKLELRRASGERDVDFAFRALQRIRKVLTYKCEEGRSRRASQVCRDGWSDCGGISSLYVAALRANGVPARVLPGRFAKSGGDPCHVTTEFFAAGVGWVPVEITSAVSFKDAPDTNSFGRDRGDFLAFHTDSDLVLDTKVVGERPVPFGQWVEYWVDGTGTWKDHTKKVKWEVKARPAR